jgi:hypothetical protein
MEKIMAKLMKSTIHLMAEKWPSPFVARNEVERFSGGILTSKYMANLDSAGKGPQGRIRVGRKVAYRVDILIEWLQSRTTALD